MNGISSERPARSLSVIVALWLCLAASPAVARQAGEDCIRFDPYLHEVVEDPAGFLITHAGHRLMLFDHFDEARLALEVMRYYGMNMSCYVGRPDASLHYFLIEGQAPVGAMAKEDCERFDREALAVVEADGQWQITQGGQPWMAFGGARSEAELSLSIILDHRFDALCYIGRPDPSMRYLRRGDPDAAGDESVASSLPN